MSLVVTPTYPAAGESCTLSLTSATGTERVYQLTSKPSASALELGFLTTTLDGATPAPTSSRQVLDLECQTDEFEPDVAGEYGFTAYDFRHVVGTPSYPGDPAGEVRHELVATQTGTVHVGDYVDMAIRTLWGSKATLRLTVVNATVRVAELVDPSDEHARVACLSANVTAPIAALVGVAVSSLATELIAGTNDLRTNYEAHRVMVGGVHAVADNTNAVAQDHAYSQVAACNLLNRLRTVYMGHATEDVGHSWHVTNDFLALPVAPESFDLASGWLLMADLRERCYEVHRLLNAGDSPAVHGAAEDATNVLSAAKPLDTAVAAVLTEFAAAAPTAATGESDGILLLSAMVGARARLQRI